MMQRYALLADRDYRLTRKERERLMSAERLKDEQEEYWRAYKLLRDTIHESQSRRSCTACTALSSQHQHRQVWPRG